MTDDSMRHGINEPDRPDVLTWLQGWYADQTDGDWEHAYGIKIDTLDNPGWAVVIDLAGTSLFNEVFDRREVHRSEDDWFVVWRENDQWQLACGPLNLAEGLCQFAPGWSTAGGRAELCVDKADDIHERRAR
jgi:hypothetical protein